jgi:protein SCO1/2
LQRLSPQRNPPTRRDRCAVLWLLGALSLGQTAVAHGQSPPAAVESPRERSAAALMDAVMWNREPVGGPFSLVDTQGNPRRDTDFRDKLSACLFRLHHLP